MESKAAVYCVCCGLLWHREQAGIIFRTGFYKVTIPLGKCAACLKAEAEFAEAACLY